MIKIPDQQTTFFDVDNTLVLWHDFMPIDESNIHKAIKLNAGDYYVMCLPHEKHIQSMKEHKARGHSIVVWSQGGADWAEEVVKKLGLESIVDVVMSKPTWAYDDLPASAFIPEAIRIWKQP